MKFVSWNVNGIRACMKKGFLDYFNSVNADFFCIQEIKLSENQIELDLPGYYQYYNYAEKKGYSGTAIFTKHKPLNVTYGEDNEGRVIHLEYEDFHLINVYTPNSQDELKRLDYRLQWDEEFRNMLISLDKLKPVITCGDFNVAHKEIDIKNPKNNVKNAGFTPEERNSFSKLLDSGFVDSFRHFYPDETGAYSWWSYRFKARERNAGWRLDYWLISNRILAKIIDSKIESTIIGSDHCPVVLEGLNK